MILRYSLVVGFAAVLSACSESGSPAPTPIAAPPPPPPATATSVSATGVITGFGSIFINGVRYEFVNGTIVSVEDENDVVGDDTLLRLGMRVRIRATETNGDRVADRIEFDDDLRGPADNISPDASDPTIGTFTVIGQTVTVDGNTVFDDDVGDNDGVPGIDIRDLDPANFPGNAQIVVEVSGYPTETGVIATRIERVNAAAGDIGKPGVAGDELEVKGFVDDVAADGSSFTINGATFLVSGTIFEDGLGANSDLIGVFVEVKFDIDAAGDFIAIKVELEDDLDGAEQDDEFEIEGILQSVDTIDDPDIIVINGVTIEVTDASSLVAHIGVKVEVKGSFNSDGILVINETEVEVENSIRTEDRITSIDTTAGSFTTRLGLVITPTADSRVEDEVGADGDQLSPAEFISRLVNDDYIEARGYPDGAGGVIWTRIEREDEDGRQCELRGPVEAGSISDPTFDILGVTINTTGLGFDDFEDADDMGIGRTDFFNQLQAGDVVEAESDNAGVGCTTGSLSTMTDGEVSFEPDDGVAGTEPPNQSADDNDNNDKVAGAVRNLNATNNTFEIAGRTITVTADTLFDDSIVEAVRGVELGDADLRFGDLPETLDQLLSNGDQVTVKVDASGNAILIEDNG